MTKNHWNFINPKRFHDAEIESLNLSGHTENPINLWFFLSQSHPIIMPVVPPQFIHPIYFYSSCFSHKFSFNPHILLPSIFNSTILSLAQLSPSLLFYYFQIQTFFWPKILLTRKFSVHKKFLDSKTFFTINLNQDGWCLFEIQGYLSLEIVQVLHQYLRGFSPITYVHDHNG